MASYLIQLPINGDSSILLEKGIKVKESMCCVNCVVANLTEEQAIELSNLGFKLFNDSMCGVNNDGFNGCNY